MMKKSVLWIIRILCIALLVVGALLGRQYYNDRYVGSEYYAMVPLNYDMTPKTLYAMSGEAVGTGVEYNLTAYNEKGESQTVNLTVKEESGSYPQPGSYLWFKASKQLVISWSVISESNIPEKALEKIKRNN